MVTKGTSNDAYAYWYQSDRALITPRKATGPEDFGDQETVGLHLKKCGSNYFHDPEGFGVWLGKHGEKYVVGIKSVYASPLKFQFISCYVYDSIEEVKRCWQLD